MILSPEQLRSSICFLADWKALGGPKFFDDPVDILVAWRPGQILPLLEQLERSIREEKLWAAGFLSYEAAQAFGLPCHNTLKRLPLAWFGLFREPKSVIYPPLSALDSLNKPQWSISGSKRDYHAAVDQVLSWIKAGDTYQVNLTRPAWVKNIQDPAALFLNLHQQHRHPYAAWINSGDGNTIASFSPELFFKTEGQRITSAPIKGTRPRGCDVVQDCVLAHALEVSAKDHAEHVMIVDMVRNDLGQVCQPGTIQVPHLFERRSFPTVHHLETRVEGVLKDHIGITEIMVSLFPAASITGAPKRRTMEIIRELETSARGIYTGTIGVIAPNGQATFNVAIRTLLCQKDQQGRLGLGGGVVAESDPASEWQELKDKGHFLDSGDDLDEIGLIETCFVDKNASMPFAEQHQKRMADSAKMLGIAFDALTMQQHMNHVCNRLKEEGTVPAVLRFELKSAGLTCTVRDLGQNALTALDLLLYRQEPVDRMNILLRHKTTRREFYNRALKSAQDAGSDEALLINNLGNITEGSIRSIMMYVDHKWITPARHEGVMKSVWRDHMKKALNPECCSVTFEMLKKAELIIMGNSVRGSVVVHSIQEQDGQIVWRYVPSTNSKAILSTINRDFNPWNAE
ncbi:MAG: chorismate-binding protein [Magnetococcales bacterium]|nr:chorismate-binding protein [Magnetococcales bacterium]